MSNATIGKWWGRVLFGVVALIFGILVLVWPGVTLAVFIFLFGFFVIVGGIILVGFAFSKSAAGVGSRWLFAIEGILMIIIGVIALIYPGLTALTLLYIFAFFLIITGAIEMGQGIFLPGEAKAMFGTGSRVLLFISGLLSFVIGIFFIAYPGTGILALLWLVGLYAIVVGIINIAMGFAGRSAARPVPTQ